MPTSARQSPGPRHSAGRTAHPRRRAACPHAAMTRYVVFQALVAAGGWVRTRDARPYGGCGRRGCSADYHRRGGLYIRPGPGASTKPCVYRTRFRTRNARPYGVRSAMALLMSIPNGPMWASAPTECGRRWCIRHTGARGRI